MKQYRLASWPDLRPPFQHAPYRRIVSDMSHRHVTVAQLVVASGLRRREVRKFIQTLCDRGLIVEQKATPSASMFSPLRPFGGWIRRSLAGPVARRDR